jgi:hypothetical protein
VYAGEERQFYVEDLSGGDGGGNGDDDEGKDSDEDAEGVAETRIRWVEQQPLEPSAVRPPVPRILVYLLMYDFG